MKTLGWVAAGFVVSVAGCGGKSATVSSVDLPKLEVDLPTLEAGRVPDDSVYGGGFGCTVTHQRRRDDAQFRRRARSFAWRSRCRGCGRS